MTEITATTETDHGSDDHTRPQPPVGTLEHLDPHAAAIGDNVRDNAALDKAFLDSITQHGVRVVKPLSPQLHQSTLPTVSTSRLGLRCCRVATKRKRNCDSAVTAKVSSKLPSAQPPTTSDGQ